jgi:hypothetical protein
VSEVNGQPPVGDDEEPVGSGAENPADETRRRFREALERKKATPGTHPGSQAAGGHTMKGSNSKRQRQFRRKSG